jgi:hypothetical protein
MLNRVLVVACLVGSCALANADGVLPLPTGTHIRVMAPQMSSRRLTGTLAAASEREIVIDLSPTERMVIPRNEVTRLEWSPGRHGHAIGGALVGGLLGGAFLAYASAALCESENCGPDATATLVGVALGALPGAGIGALIRTRTWAEASPARVQVSLLPVRGRGVALSATLRF